MIGFLSGIKTINNSTQTITSDRAVDITDTYNSIYIRLPNLSNQKVITSTESRYSNIIAHIPVPFNRNTIFIYEPVKPFTMELNQNSISAIDIGITFQDENKRVHFGRGDWEVNLLVEYKENYSKLTPNNILNRNIIRQMKKFEEQEKESEKRFNELKKLIKK